MAIELVHYDDVQAFIAEHGRIPSRVYGAPSGKYISHPDTGASVPLSSLSNDERERWKIKNRANGDQKITIMRDSEPFISPITGEVIGGRAARREHIARHDVIEAGDVDFEKESRTGWRESTDREIEDDLRVAKEKYEQGYYRNNPHADEEDDLKWNEIDQNLRSGGFA